MTLVFAVLVAGGIFYIGSGIVLFTWAFIGMLYDMIFGSD